MRRSSQTGLIMVNPLGKQCTTVTAKG